MKKWSELKHTTRCAIVDIICLILGILLLTFCSCDVYGDYHYAEGGIITEVKINCYKKNSTGEYTDARYRCKVKCSALHNGVSTNFYLLTDSLYQVGQRVQIK